MAVTGEALPEQDLRQSIHPLRSSWKPRMEANGAFFDDTKAETLKAMMESGREYGAYRQARRNGPARLLQESCHVRRLAEGGVRSRRLIPAARAAQHLTRPGPMIDGLIALRLVLLVTRMRGLATNATTLLIDGGIDGIMSACGRGVAGQFSGAGSSEKTSD